MYNKKKKGEMMEKGQVLTDLLEKLSLSNPDLIWVLLPCAIAFAGGYTVYIFCLLILAKEHTSCYPSWMHTFFCACDVLGSIFWAQEALQNDNFWAFWAFSVCMAIWVVLELVSMYYSVKYERQEVLGNLYSKPVTTSMAARHLFVQFIMWTGVISSVIYFMGGYADAAFFKLYFWTNLMVALGPCWHWMRRGVKTGRVGAGVAIQIMILITIIITWTPAGIGMWCTISDYFWTPICIYAGIVVTCFAVYNLVYQWKLPKKPVVIQGKKPLP